MCGKTWSDIDYDKDVTSVTLSRSSKAFRNKTKTGEQRSTDEDRIKAAAKYEAWLASKVTNGQTVKGSRVGVNDLVKQAYNPGGQSEIEATENLNLINKFNDTNFIMSYSFGRALQQSALKFWSQDIQNIDGTQKIFNQRAKMNTLAALGKWSKELEN